MHAASIAGGRPGVLHGNRTYLLQDDDGQIIEAHSISAGLDYPGIGPEHSWLHEIGRVEYLSATDDEALDAFQLLSKLEGIIPALEPAHAIAKVMKLAPKRRQRIRSSVVNLSGRGDKDIFTVAAASGRKADHEPHRRRFAALKKPKAAPPSSPSSWPAIPTATSLRDPQGAAEGRRRHHRDRHALHRSDGRRPGDPGAGLRALKAGMTLKKTLEMVRASASRRRPTPIVLMGYYNPIYIYGVDKFLADAKSRRRRRWPDHRRPAAGGRRRSCACRR
jgi:hypothetical protein